MLLNKLKARFLQLDLRGKITVVLLAASLAMGLLVVLVVSLIVIHMTVEHGHDVHLFSFLLPLFLFMGLCVVAGSLLFARISVRLIATPLLDVAAAAEAIAASGRPAGQLAIPGGDEFGRLSAAFNTMVERLQESYADLEQRVAERTLEFEESRHAAEKAIRLLREAVDNVAVGLAIYDEADCLVMCNEAYLRIYEESRDLIVPGARFADIVRKGAERGQYKEALGNVDAWVMQRIALHRQARGEISEQRLSNGRWLMVVEQKTPSGYIVGNRIDITEVKQTTEALHQRELYLRATLDNLPFFFWLKDADSRFLAVNKLFADACGRRSPEEVVGLTDYDVWPADLAERYRADDFEVIASRKEKTVEEPVAGGSQAGWIETYKKPVIADDGRVIGTVGFARDISDRHLAELKIREHSEQLRAIFELSPDGFVSFDAAHCVKYASPAFVRMTELPENDIIGSDENEFSARLAELCVENARFPGIAALQAASPRRQIIEMAGPGKRVIEVGLQLSEAETVSQILYFRDVTHETEVDQMKSEFLSTAAHELRTPMASIYGFSELMLMQEFSAEERREFIGAIHRQSELMVSIINELLDLARIEARRGKDFKFDRIDLSTVVAEIVGNFKVPEGRAAPVIESAAAAECWVRADRKKLIQAIGNILSNAYKYSPAGGAVEILLCTHPPASEYAGMAGVAVRDHGIGLTPEQLGRVCERFYRADTSGKIPGTGLGMSIVKEIIDLHGGHMMIKSQLGAGTEVSLLIPVANTESTPGTPA